MRDSVEEVWFSQGGGLLYNNLTQQVGMNASRIIRYVPSLPPAIAFSCFNVPTDNAQIIGLLVDITESRVWYAEASYFNDAGTSFVGNALSSLNVQTATSNCDWDPNVDPPDSQVCVSPFDDASGCHTRIPLSQDPSWQNPDNSHIRGSWPAHLVKDPRDNSIWFTQAVSNPRTSGAAPSNRIGRLDTAALTFTEAELGETNAEEGPGSVLGSSPWQLEFDVAGDLWVTEQFDASISMIDLSDEGGTCFANPEAAGCHQEIELGNFTSTGHDGRTTHSVATGLDPWSFIDPNPPSNPDRFIFFAQSGGRSIPPYSGVPSEIAIVLPDAGNAAVFLPALPGHAGIAGMSQDGSTGDVWFALHGTQQLGRLILNDDNDGIADAVDNCPAAFNPLQEDTFGGLAGDACDVTVNPLDVDNDGFDDTQRSAHLGPAQPPSPPYWSPLSDNCPSSTNPFQTNTDGNFADQSPPYAVAVDDKTWPMSDASGDACDTDDDNDGLSDTLELSGVLCSGVQTEPLLFDTDGDRVHDGKECSLGTNPTSASSKPTGEQCGAATDTDGDRLLARIEACGYNTDPGIADSDSDGALDGARDGCEAASLDGNRTVNATDQLLLGQEIIRVLGGATPLASMDINKDGNINSADQLLQGQLIQPQGQCP